MTTPEIHVLPDPQALAREAADRLVAVAAEAVALSGRFTVALSGGSTPKALYELLASDEYAEKIDWSVVEVYFGDERCVPPDHADSNHRMARQALLDHVPLPRTSVYRMRGEIEPEAAAIEYGQLLKGKFGDRGLDLALLGLGDDAHTASIFPDTAAVSETHHRCVANFVPKLDAWRLTMTAPFLNRSHNVMALVAGKGKADAVQQVLEGPRNPHLYPMQLIQPTGRFLWLMDAAAAGM